MQLRCAGDIAVEARITLHGDVHNYRIACLHHAEATHAHAQSPLLIENAKQLTLSPGGVLAVVERLMKTGCRLHEPDDMGVTPWHTACEAGDRELVSFLLAQGCSVDSCTDDGSSALHFAARSGSPMIYCCPTSVGMRMLSLTALHLWLSTRP